MYGSPTSDSAPLAVRATLWTADLASCGGVCEEVDGLLVCHECGRGYSNLAQHVLGRHDMTPETYRGAHGLGTSVALTSSDTHPMPRHTRLVKPCPR